MTITTTAYADQAAAEDAIREAAPDAVELTAIGNALDYTMHRIFLDAPAGRVLWAYEDPDGDTWTLGICPAADAVPQIEEQLTSVRWRLEHPDDYANYSATVDVDGDLDAMDELHDVQLAAIVAATPYPGRSPRDEVTYMDRVLKERVEETQREAHRMVARAAALRAYHLQSQIGDRRGDQEALAARLYGTSAPTLSAILKRERERRESIRQAATEARRESA